MVFFECIPRQLFFLSDSACTTSPALPVSESTFQVPTQNPQPFAGEERSDGAATHTHTHTNYFTALLDFVCDSPDVPAAGSRKVKPGRYNQSGFTGARDSEWYWHQLGHMQICTLTQTHNFAFSVVILAEVQICIWPSRCHCHSLSLAPINRDWFYLPGFTFLVLAHLGSPG